MKNNKTYTSIFLLFMILISGAIYFSFDKVKNIDIDNETKNALLAVGDTQKKVEINNKESISVSIKVLNKTYTGSVKRNSSVYDAMVEIEKQNKGNFIFKGREYSGLGFFVEEINGIKGVADKYWIYYINNIKASVGISKSILKDGDVVTWKQEASL